LCYQDSCDISTKIKKNTVGFDYCDSDYSFAKEDKADYDYSWGTFNATYTAPVTMPYIYAAFQYRNASSLEGKSYQSLYKKYSGGGYIYQVIIYNFSSLVISKSQLVIHKRLEVDWMN
jgi:hypothetical protein